jgi:crotonobetainyl-CoA:carnitine CoA-transferase CaiB-like acyl-CoA transferase
MTVGLPLEGIRVLSVALQYPGPYATLLLADLGADVVVVERPDGGDPTRAFPGFHGSLARNKRAVALDLKSSLGRDAFRRLAERADVLLEGFRPGTMARLGLDYAALAATNPDLVWVSISGFGQTGPDRDRPGHDLTYQAEAGMLYEHVPPAAPPPPPTLALGDLTAGLLAVQAVLVGLVQQRRTGHGTEADVAMVDGLVSLLSAHAGPVLSGTGPPGYPYEPGYGVFVTADGAHLALGVAHEDHFWRALCHLTGLEDEGDLTSAQRFAAHGRLRGRLAAAVARRPMAHWERALGEADVPYGRVRALAELPESPQIRARGLLVDLGDAGIHVRQPLAFDGVAPGPTSGPPVLGQHTVAVLTEAGLGLGEIEALLVGGVAFQAPDSATETLAARS